MDDLNTIPIRRKIGPAVLARLAQSKPTQKVRAIVVLNTTRASAAPRGTRPTRNERRAAIDEVRNQASQALPRIDVILSRFGGRRLSDTPTALGTIAVESTPAGIAALCESDSVRAILQDQPISRVV